MIADLLSGPCALGTFSVAVLIFGFAPGLVLAAIVRLIPDSDRRQELQAELYEVPRWERPFWVAQQFESALRLGLWPRISWAWGRHVWHRSSLQSGSFLHRNAPATFWIPSSAEKSQIGPGDLVYLVWSVARFPGERMWVRVTHLDGNSLRGTLQSCPLFAYLDSGDEIRFTLDNVIDYDLVEEAASAV